MKEFMFFIRKQGNRKETLSSDTHQKFLKSCELYIDQLKKEGKLISAQPVEWSGEIISSVDREWNKIPFNESQEIIGGYYHILAKDIEEAIALAKGNPEFEFNPKTRIEIRPIKLKEETTGFVYPVA
jgi:hypothetical protein